MGSRICLESNPKTSAENLKGGNYLSRICLESSPKTSPENLKGGNYLEQVV
jgi:hypothetical protein